MEFKLTKDLPPEEVLTLYQEAGWWGNDDDPKAITVLLAGSFRVAAAFDGKRLTGMARALSDGISDAYIQDVAVHKEFRQQGIGTRLVTMLAAELRKCGIGWIGLIGVPGSEPFYRKCGFAPLSGHVPMIFAEKLCAAYSQGTEASAGVTGQGPCGPCEDFQGRGALEESRTEPAQ